MRALKTRQDLILDVNGEHRRVSVRPADTLLYTLRQELGLTGAKPGCENGDCGACTVIVDGSPIKSCMMLTAELPGHAVTTVEGLKKDTVQDAFLGHWAFQCGYCTSGFIMLTRALVDSHPAGDQSRTTEWLRSNICRCTGYEEIMEAVSSLMSPDEASQESQTPDKEKVHAI